MAIDIFRLNWILVDTVVIILLIIALISVRIFKEMYRYRFSLSNENLECINYGKSEINFRNINILIRNWALLRDKTSKKKSSSKPVIILIKTNYKKRLIQVLSEGFVSYGFDVVNLHLKIKSYSHFRTHEELGDTIFKILNFFKQNELIKNSNYIVIQYTKSNLNYHSIVTDDNCKGIILINPKLKREFKTNLHEMVKDVNSNFYIHTIFNKKSIFYTTNKNYKTIIREFNEDDYPSLKITSFERANSSFKYYETVLLGVIIKKMENYSLDS